jgi:hypothetical protein
MCALLWGGEGPGPSSGSSRVMALREEGAHCVPGVENIRQEAESSQVPSALSLCLPH